MSLGGSGVFIGEVRILRVASMDRKTSEFEPKNWTVSNDLLVI